MSAFTGTERLLRLALRRDRVVLPSWVVGTSLLVLGTASSFAQISVPDRLPMPRRSRRAR